MARDGRALAWFELDSGVPAKATLAIYDAVSHETLRPELSSEPTSGPVAISSGFAIIDRHGVIRVFDTAHRMNSSRPQPTEIRVSWPVDVDTDHLPMLLASTRDQLLVAQSSSGASAYGGPQDVFLVGLDGSTTKVIEGTNGQAGPLHNLPFGPVAVTPDLSQVAITGWSRAERCVEVSDIDAVRLPSGAPVAVPPPPSPPAGSFEKVLSLHYGGGGDLIASIVDVPTNCADGSLTPHLFELSGQRWHALDQDGRWSARSGLGTLAVIRSPVAIQHGIVDAFGPGRLEVVASNGSSSTIANEVLQAAWDPVTSHVAVPAP